MGKALALAGTGTGAATVVVGSYYLASNGRGAGEEIEKEKQTLKDLSFKTLEEFKTDPTKVGCVKNYFTGLQPNESAQVIEAQKPDNNSFFKSGSDKNATQKSCLLVEYKKETYAGDKWKGTIFWLWTFSTESEGFISFNMAETTDANKIKFTGIFYLVSKKDAGENNWEISYKAEATSADQVEAKDLDSYFPKAVTDLVGDNKSYWGFLTTNKESDLQKVCSTSNTCTTSEAQSSVVTQEFNWTKNDADGSKTLKDWTDKLDWWNKLYSSAKAHWDLTTKIENFKGKWSSTTTQSNP